MKFSWQHFVSHLRRLFPGETAIADCTHIITRLMPRRPPPSALRLFQGPLPPRAQPKHSLPSMPCPSFYPAGTLPHRAHLTMPLVVHSSATKRLRGPWDASSSVVDVDSLLAVPKPVAVC